MGAFAAGLATASRPELSVLGGCLAALALLAVTAARRPLVCVLVAVLVPLGAAMGAARLAAIDRSPLRSLAGRDVTVRGHVVKRERTSFGVRRLRMRVTEVAGRGPVRDLIQLRIPIDGLPNRTSLGIRSWIRSRTGPRPATAVTRIRRRRTPKLVRSRFTT